MDLKITKETVCVSEIIYDGSIEQAIDSDITLPDYCPDILRVLKCTIMPRINSTQATGDRITVDGSALLRVMYVAESGRLHCYEQNIPFSNFVENKELEANPFVKVKIKTEYINCRAVSQRRLDIHGALSINFLAVLKKPRELLSDAQGAGIQTKRKNVEVNNVVGSANRAFSLADVLEIGASKPPIAQMVRTSAFATTSEIKIISNKVMIKGDLVINAMYTADTEQGTLETIETSLPISQVVELAGITEECMTDIRLDLTSIDIIPKPDSSGSMRLLDITARIDATLNATKAMTVPIIIDAYSTQYEIETQSKTVEFKSLVENFTETNLCRDSIDVSGIGVKRVLDMWCTDVTTESKFQSEELIIDGAITVCMLVEDADSQISYLERQVNYEHKRSVMITQKVECDSFVSVCASSFVIGAGDSIDVRIETRIQSSIFSVSSKKMIDSININEDKGKKKNKAALTIYFSQQGETVWEIAQRYNTTVEAIMLENSLTEDKILENAMLLIPAI